MKNTNSGLRGVISSLGEFFTRKKKVNKWWFLPKNEDAITAVSMLFKIADRPTSKRVKMRDGTYNRLDLYEIPVEVADRIVETVIPGTTFWQENEKTIEFRKIDF